MSLQGFEMRGDLVLGWQYSDGFLFFKFAIKPLINNYLIGFLKIISK